MSIKFNDVFHARANETPLSYSPRRQDELLSAIRSGKSVVISGPSKIGKSALRREGLRQHLSATGASDFLLFDFANYKSGKEALSLTAIEVQTNGERRTSATTLERALNSESHDMRPIVVENYHFLREAGERKNISNALSGEGAQSRPVIFVGIWLRETDAHAAVFAPNGSLAGRTKTIQLQGWSRTELSQIIEKGEALLKLNFSNDFRNCVLDLSHGSALVVQEICRRQLESLGDSTGMVTSKLIGSERSAEAHCRKYFRDLALDYGSQLAKLASGKQKRGHHSYRYLFACLINLLTDSLEDVRVDKQAITEFLRQRRKRRNGFLPTIGASLPLTPEEAESAIGRLPEVQEDWGYFLLLTEGSAIAVADSVFGAWCKSLDYDSRTYLIDYLIEGRFSEVESGSFYRKDEGV